MHSVQEYLTDADTWQVAEAHALADTGAFDVIYGAGCHCAQPIEQYNDTWIIYGLGNALTVDAPPENIVNNQGVTARVQFAGKKGQPGTWRVSRIDWLPTANKRQGVYQWCPLSQDHPDGACWSEEYDAQVRTTDLGRGVFHGCGPDRGTRMEDHRRAMTEMFTLLNTPDDPRARCDGGEEIGVHRRCLPCGFAG